MTIVNKYVWVVTLLDYYGKTSEILGIFSTKKSAMNMITNSQGRRLKVEKYVLNI